MTEKTDQFRISTLNCEPVTVNNSHCSEQYYGLKYPFVYILWRVFIDQKCIATQALPFEAWYNMIELAANECMPYWGEGSNYMAVRKSGSYILWFEMSDYDEERLDKIFPRSSIFIFDTQQYATAINKVTSLISEHQLPEDLLADELRTVLKTLFPGDLDLPLYRIPEADDDPRGKRLFRNVLNAIGNETLQICEPPEQYVELRIGLDFQNSEEAVWLVGKVKDDVAILFITEPYFPAWVSGFGQAFLSETFLHLDG